SALLVAATAGAAPITIASPNGNFAGGLDPAANGLFFSTLGTEVARMTIDDFVPSITPQTRTANEANAADFGLDWEALTEWGLGLAEDDNNNTIHKIGFFSGTNDHEGGAPLLPLDLPAHHHLVGFVIDHIEFNVPFWLPNASRVQFNIVGDGTIVPEPTALLAVVPIAMGLVFALSRKRRRA
ncbi:MAG: hypothetical protein WD971_00775, partial [Pirellulales bacterium]